MPMIEGFGDEVTYGMMVLLAVLLITVCWLSTQLRFIPFVNVFILESMQDLVDTNVSHSDIIVPVAPDVPAEAASPPTTTDDAPQTAEPSDNTTEVENTQAEALKNESEVTLTTEDGVQQEEDEKSSSEEPAQSNEAESSETPESAEPTSEGQSISLTSESDAPLETQITARTVDIKLIYINNTHRIVRAQLTDTVGDFRRLHFEKELSENKTVRFIFHGKCLANDVCTLESCNVKRNSVIHCLVTPSLVRRPEDITPNSAGQTGALNPENGHDTAFELVLYPSIIIVFAVLWYLQFTYDQVTLYPCIMSILGVSFFLLAMSLAIYRTIRIRAAHRAIYN